MQENLWHCNVHIVIRTLVQDGFAQFIFFQEHIQNAIVFGNDDRVFNMGLQVRWRGR